MTLNLTLPQQTYSDFTPRITVIGVGGGGTNAVDNMIALQLQGVEFVVANTDAQQLTHSRADRRIQLGPHLTQGLGAGAKPEIGRAAAEEAADELARHLDGAHMVFITAGMGGGTGTGAAPVIARMARERGILTVGVVTKPFTFEGVRRGKAAETGISELQQFVDTLIVIPNQNLFRLANERTGWKEAFKMADHVLYMGVRGVTDLMVAPGLVNLDFADIRTVMAEMGKAMMGTGESDGENRAIRAAEAAISNPLLEDTSMAGARGLLINITGGDDMTLFEVDQAANRIREEVAEDANIIFGSAIDESLTGRIRVSVVATGIDTPVVHADRPRMNDAAQISQPIPYPTPGAIGHGAPQPAYGGSRFGGPARKAVPATGPIGAPVLTQQGPRPGHAPGHASDNWSQFAAAAEAPAPTPNYAAPSQSSHGGYASAGSRHDEQDYAQAPSPSALPNPLPSQQAAGQLASGLRAASPRSGLFSEPPRGHTEPAPAPAPSRSLFGIVTGALRRGAAPMPGASPQMTHDPRRAEPQLNDPYHHEAGPDRAEAPTATVRPVAAEEAGLDIPAFLRRQS
ncbi:cell division protein FtsZ [Lichenicoccus sp.]|uniref:cell division protein FtsZ n=1 Tax=Lichenicoccus sp. TaxID=2781899 RepID=UPI003D12387C